MTDNDVEPSPGPRPARWTDLIAPLGRSVETGEKTLAAAVDELLAACEPGDLTRPGAAELIGDWEHATAQYEAIYARAPYMLGVFSDAAAAVPSMEQEMTEAFHGLAALVNGRTLHPSASALWPPEEQWFHDVWEDAIDQMPEADWPVLARLRPLRIFHGTLLLEADDQDAKQAIDKGGPDPLRLRLQVTLNAAAEPGSPQITALGAALAPDAVFERRQAGRSGESPRPRSTKVRALLGSTEPKAQH
ncbi:hypothetical protein KV557_24460 [Kitasatospora aureofaciens]|uniref:hypothetical protein n=1 Tax=Kitasatospora aureofaciens TaxID=1894 RepID=UPI001C47B4C0|nr:hypothetical protein [Kitasatospora aureofaciens]MBV6700217.1 hypothetical protein [Kitasatospora aureofaciens]